MPNANQPIDVYWLMLAENGRREELTWMERKMAYGFEVSKATPQGFTLQLAAYKQRLIRVEKAGESFRARIFISGKPATLTRLFIFSDGGIVPKVRYVDLYGITDERAKVSERIHRLIVPSSTQRWGLLNTSKDQLGMLLAKA